MGKKRIEGLDVARTFAIFTVIVCHTTESVYQMKLSFMEEQSVWTRIAAFVLFTIGRLGVPIFLMLTGYLLLGRLYNAIRVKRFWKRNLLPLLVTTEIWIVIYFLLTYVNGESSAVDWGLLIRQMLFLAPIEEMHTWYLPVILGIYLFIPFISNLLCQTETKMVAILLAVLVIYLMAVPTLNVVVQIAYGVRIENNLTLAYIGGLYGVYTIIGCWIKRGFLKGCRPLVLIVISAVSFAAAVGLQLYAYTNGMEYNIWYSCILLLICTAPIFELTTRIHLLSQRRRAAFETISRHAFGIYLVHIIVMDWFLGWLSGENLRYLRVAAVSLLTFLVSWLIVWAVGKIPRVGKAVFLVK